jgi:hypothetical protein
VETRARPRGVRRRRRGRLGRVRPRAASRGEIRAHLATHVETASSTLGLRANCEKNEERRERNVRENEERRRRRRGVIGTPRNARARFRARDRVCPRAQTRFQRSGRLPDAPTRTHFARLFSYDARKPKRTSRSFQGEGVPHFAPSAQPRRAETRARARERRFAA